MTADFQDSPLGIPRYSLPLPLIVPPPATSSSSRTESSLYERTASRDVGSTAFSAAYSTLYLRQLDLRGIRLAEVNRLLLAVPAVVEVPVRPTLAPLL